jgi:single-stranded-DNA-specific exonuclease
MKWILKTADPQQVERLAPALIAECGIAPNSALTLARLLAMRGIADGEAAARFLKPSISQLHSPYRMKGMKEAVDRIEAAIEQKEPILIYGDYDVDGTTAIVILKTAIELCEGAADFHVPHRIRDGYDMRGLPPKVFV